jgi:NADH-quinone oxidoreductase subunit F
VVNNVETIASVPSIVTNGAQWYTSYGSEKSPGVKLFAVSGHVERPGIYEAPMGTTMRELLEWSGGIRKGHRLKFWVPGGSSVPLLTEEDIAAAGSMLGTGTPMVFDETTSVTRAVTRWLEFYKHESCGKCTPCREGTYWLVDLLRRLESGTGSQDDITRINEVSAQIAGRSFCALGDAAATPFPGAMKYFADEIALGTSSAASDLYDPVAATVFSGVNA